MTEIEKEITVAIEHLKARNMSAKHIDMAIQALEEIQRQKTKIGMFVTLEERMEISSRFAKLEQYEAIGTVEEIKRQLELAVDVYDNSERLINTTMDMLMEYQKIGTIEEFKALKEKSEPKELAEHNLQDEVHHYLCPSCRSIVSCTQNYCDECGQSLET